MVAYPNLTIKQIKEKEIKETLLTFGKNDKIYKNIKEAKSDLGVKKAADAYILLLNLYNTEINNLNKAIIKSEHKQKERKITRNLMKSLPKLKTEKNRNKCERLEHLLM